MASSSAQPCLHGQPWTRPGAFHCTRIGRRGRRVVPRSIRLSAAAPDSAASGLRRRTCDSGRPRELSSILVRGSAPRKPFPAWLLAFSMPARLSLNLLSLYCFNQPLASFVAVLATGTTVTWWYRGGGRQEFIARPRGGLRRGRDANAASVWSPLRPAAGIMARMAKPDES